MPSGIPGICTGRITLSYVLKGENRGMLISAAIAVIKTIQKLIGFLLSFHAVYFITGLFTTRKFPPAKKQHKYAVLVAARNEEKVIGNLIDSIHMQDYPSELVTVFVVADNCTDRTAGIARERGALCYERQDPDHRTKGFALQYLVKCIDRDYGVDSYEGYFIFDADNLLKGDYITRMNEAFDAGEKIVTSYRNTKNFGDNWISASYALHWMRTQRTEHRARSVFRLATRIQGTGFLFTNEIIKNGWNYTSLTEDRAFCADAVVNGYRISYNNDAEFYDEQPTDLKIAMRQRIRWSKGHIQAFAESGGKLFAGIFRFFGRLRSFMCYDMFFIVTPVSLVSMFCRWSAVILAIAQVFADGGRFSAALAIALWALYNFLIGSFGMVAQAVYVFIAERRHIPPIRWYKKVFYSLTFPIFDIIGRISLVVALFRKVEWKPIPHDKAVAINELSVKK